MPENLWPVFDIRNVRPSPRTIIDDVGKGLKERTGGLVSFYGQPSLVRDNNVLSTSFSFWTPLLKYHFPFLKVSFKVDEPYPVELVADKIGEKVARDEKELLNVLAEIFNATSTVETIERLMALARPAEDEV